MTGYQPERLESFRSRDGSQVLTFGLAQFEWDSDQSLLVPSLPLIAADYAYDQLGTNIAHVQPGTETVRWLELQNSPGGVDTAIRNAQALALTIGLGKLFTVDSSNAYRWAYARAVQLPSLAWTAGQIFQKTVKSLAFRRQSDWQAASLTTVTVTYSSSPHTFTVTNPGSRRVKDGVILLSGTWHSTVSIQNTTNGYGFTYDFGDSGSSSSDQVRFDSGANRVDRSTDGGVTWSNVFSRYTPNSGQNQMMILEPGANSFTVTDGGTPSASLVFTFYP